MSRRPIRDVDTTAPDGGFTVTEMLVSLMLLSVGALATFHVFAASARATSSGGLRATAVQIANAEMEVLRAWPYDQVALDPNDAGAGFFEGNPIVTAAPVPTVPTTGQTGALTFRGALQPITPGMCLQSDGTALRQYTCDPLSAPPLAIHTRTDGWVTISGPDGRCFAPASLSMGATLVPRSCVETTDQLWSIVSSFGGAVQFQNRATGWCMDVRGNSSANGAVITMWGFGSAGSGTCKSTASLTNHDYRLTRIGSPGPRVQPFASVTRAGTTFSVERMVTWRPVVVNGLTRPSAFKLLTVQVAWIDTHGTHRIRLDGGLSPVQTGR